MSNINAGSARIGFVTLAAAMILTAEFASYYGGPKSPMWRGPAKN